jgi:hypothetical protein
VNAEGRQASRFDKANDTHNHCGICGHVPRGAEDQPNKAPLRWWDPDDGYKIGTLCGYCFRDCGDVKPDKDDYAYLRSNGVCDSDPDTDEDASMVFF